MCTNVSKLCEALCQNREYTHTQVISNYKQNKKSNFCFEENCGIMHNLKNEAKYLQLCIIL